MKKIVTSLISGVVILTTVFGFKLAAEGSNESLVTINESQLTRDEIKIHREITVKNEVTILGVGDVLISGSIYSDARTDSGFDFTSMFEHVSPIIQQADYALANQETMLGGESLGLSGYPIFNSPKEVGNALKEAGFDMLTLANNHTLDYGEEGVMNTLDHLDHIDMPYVGAYRSSEDKATLRKVDINNISFAFLSYSYGTNGMPVPDGKEYLISLIDENKMESDIKAAKEVADVVVLNLHYGEEYTDFPNEYQTNITSIAAEAGADIIFGHHPHVLQPFEWLRTSDGRDVFVAYSLGNFISGQEGVERRIGGMAQVTVKEVVAGPASFTIVDDPVFIPVYTDRTEWWREYRVLPASEMTNGILPNWQAHFNEASEHVGRWMDDVKIENNK
ncbi:CapA family protein [Alteribacter aurantiacus]|uniref:CapA family protein n=1 Tax=Alteribacter aurantiacus TaxID=254410 RepID=UPI0003F6CB9D|nr:CapA family protein [Alteribacter aurantiacus]